MGGPNTSTKQNSAQYDLSLPDPAQYRRFRFESTVFKWEALSHGGKDAPLQVLGQWLNKDSTFGVILMKRADGQYALSTVDLRPSANHVSMSCLAMSPDGKVPSKFVLGDPASPLHQFSVEQKGGVLKLEYSGSATDPNMPKSLELLAFQRGQGDPSKLVFAPLSAPVVVKTASTAPTNVVADVGITNTRSEANTRTEPPPTLEPQAAPGVSARSLESTSRNIQTAVNSSGQPPLSAPAPKREVRKEPPPLAPTSHTNVSIRVAAGTPPGGTPPATTPMLRQDDSRPAPPPPRATAQTDTSQQAKATAAPAPAEPTATANPNDGTSRNRIVFAQVPEHVKRNLKKFDKLAEADQAATTQEVRKLLKLHPTTYLRFGASNATLSLNGLSTKPATEGDVTIVTPELSAGESSKRFRPDHLLRGLEFALNNNQSYLVGAVDFNSGTNFTTVPFVMPFPPPADMTMANHLTLARLQWLSRVGDGNLHRDAIQSLLKEFHGNRAIQLADSLLGIVEKRSEGQRTAYYFLKVGNETKAYAASFDAAGKVQTQELAFVSKPVKIGTRTTYRVLNNGKVETITLTAKNGPDFAQNYEVIGKELQGLKPGSTPSARVPAQRVLL